MFEQTGFGVKQMRKTDHKRLVLRALHRRLPIDSNWGYHPVNEINHDSDAGKLT